MARFTKDSEGPEGGFWVSRFTLDLRPGHTITRTDTEERIAAGRKGRAASVSLHREMVCSCGAVDRGGDRVGAELDRMVHFESDAEREAHAERQARLRATILAKLGMAE